LESGSASGSLRSVQTADARVDRERPAEEPRLLFLPRCGSNGIGEYVRCLVLAQAMSRRHPHAAMEFALPPSWPRLPGDDFPRAPLARGAGQREAFAAMLARLRPHLIVTNNRSRRREFARARAQGVAVVAIASTGNPRRVQRLRVLRSVDQVWVVPVQGRGGVRLPSRLALWLSGRPHCEIVETLHPEADPGRAAKTLAMLGLDGTRYVFFASGGGGCQLGGRAAGEVFAAAAAQVARTGVRAVVLAGPLHRGAQAASEGVTWIDRLPPEAMVDLVSCAEVVVCAGGGLLGWVLSLGRPCVTTPMSGDQRQRTRTCRAEGTALVVEGNEPALAGGALALLADGASRQALAMRAASAGPRNSLSRCVALLEGLLDPGRGGAVP
jgi:hypothetical protein